MKNISLFKKIKLFNSYKKIVEKNKIELNSKFGIRLDNAKRLYTVLNIPEEIIGEAYSLKKSDIDKISENYIRQYTQEFSTYLNGKELNELFDIYEIKKVDKLSYLLIFGFSQFNSAKYYNTIYYIITPLVVITSLISLFLIV